MGQFIYHKVPDNMQGELLYPLNALKDKYPAAYTSHARKYEGREWLPKLRIPVLDCQWNDVIHCTPIHPAMIYPLLREIGYEYPLERFYMIDTGNWRPDECAIMTYSDDGKDRFYHNGLTVNDPDIGKLPKATVAYYKECYARNVHPMIFACTPHVLYKGAITVRDATIIEV